MDMSTSPWQRRQNGHTVPAVPVDVDLFREKLIQLEAQHRLTQEKAARRIGISGRHYVRWKKGEATPGYDSIEKVATAYDLDPDEFMLDVIEGGGVSERLSRIEGALADLHRLWQEELVPALAALEADRQLRAGQSAPGSQSTG